jgi:hypothetical protein
MPPRATASSLRRWRSASHLWPPEGACLEKLVWSQTEPDEATLLWLRQGRRALESGISGASEPEPQCSTPFGRAPHGAGGGAALGALPKGPLVWNCRGSGGNLPSSTMTHLASLLRSTRAQECFLSGTRNSSITKTTIKNWFNYNDAFVVPAQGQSGGLWMIWNDDVDITVVDHSHNFISTLCTNKSTNLQYGLVCIYGDPHHRTTKVIWDHVLHFVTLNCCMPMFYMGDLNEIMHVNEKLGSSHVDVNRITAFCVHVKQCGFIDLDYNGPSYTLTIERFTSAPTYQRLDRCLGNAEWCKAFPSTTIYHLPMMYRDHTPILAILNSNRPHTNKPFRFENWWIKEQEFQEISKLSWQRSSTRDFTPKKTKFLVADLKKWRRKKTVISLHR